MQVKKIPCALWPVDLKITHLDWNTEAVLIHFQGQYLTICELDYSILQGEIQNLPKTKTAVDIGEFCLVEDLTSARWYRGRVQNRKQDLFEVFLIDHGNALSVDISHISSCSNDLFILPPKIVCGFLANVLFLQGCAHSVIEEYFSRVIGTNVTGYIQGLLPHKILLLEAPDINNDLVTHGLGRHVDTDTFLLLVEMLTEVPLKQNTEPVPDLLIEKPRGQEFCFKPSSLHAYEEILSFCGPRLSCGTHAKVRVTAAVNPGLFYCQMASMETDLWEMSKKLAAVCEYRAKERHQMKEAENLGLLCSVKGKDGKWYRGFVQFLPVNSQVRVLFIDYGFFESVKVENVHRLPPDFDSAPIVAFPCSLCSLNDQDEAVRTQQLSFLKAGLLGEVLHVEIKSFDEEQNLYYITITGTEDKHAKKPKPNEDLPREKDESLYETEDSPQVDYLYYETIMSEALRKTLEEEELQAGSVFVGYVVHVQNPNYFWIRTQKRNDEFEELMKKIREHFSQVKLDEDVLMNPKLGTQCCAVYEEDMHFYRAVVTDTLDHGAEVFFIDFGNIEKVPHMTIKKIPEAFASSSAFAICCTLVNVLPLDEVWTCSAADFFRRAVSNKVLLVHIADIRKNKCVVDLHEMGSDDSQSITELLIASKHAEYWNNISIEPVLQNTTNVTEKTRSLKYSVTSDVSGNIVQQEEEENMCKKDVKPAQTPVIFRPLNIRPGCEFAVRCSYISSPSDFWCQPLDQVPALEELMDKVQQYYLTHTAPIQSGDSCCVARSPLDARWYRAIITEKQKGQARVISVDYGFTIQIKEHNLQAVQPEYMLLEGQAFRCNLYNLIEPTDLENCGDWSPEACNLMKDFVHDNTSTLRCKVVSQLNVKNKGPCNVVDLYNSQTQQSITDMLVEQSLARRVTVSTKQLSTVFPESFVYSSFDLCSGNEVQVYVTHVSSQCEVYCQLERNTEMFEELEKKISEESENMMRTSTKPVLRRLCLAKYLDGKWYRGLAHPVQSPQHFRVFFVDYGNTGISEKTHVMFIPRDSAYLLYTPMQALRCSLASVSKKELYADVKDWLVAAVLNKLVRAVIVAKREDDSFDVELFDGDVNINKKVNDLIVGLTPKPKTVTSFDKSKPKKDYIKTSVKLKSQPAFSPRCYIQRDTQVRSAPQQKQKNTRKYVRRRTNTNVKKQNENRTQSPVPIHPQENTKAKERERGDLNAKETKVPQLSCLPEKKLNPGFRAECFVSHIDSVNSFFLQLSEDGPAILKMGEDLNSGVRDSLKTTTSLTISDLVLAEYEDDGALYRSVLRDYEGTSCFKVEFIDYGNSAVVGKEKIYLIPKDYLSQPRFSIPCFLLDKNTYENHASFTDAVMDKRLMVDFVRQRESCWEVKIETLDREFGLPSAREAAGESSSADENKEGSLVTSTATEETVIPTDQSYCRTDVCENEESKSERMMATGEMLKPPLFTLLTKQSPKTYRCRRRRPRRNKTRFNKKQMQTSSSSFKAMGHLAETFIPLTILQPKDTENGTVLSVQSNGEFYIRLAQTTHLFAALETHIADNIYKCEMVTEEDVKQGLSCLVQVDNKWYRAFVQQVGQGKCQVLLVDHGIIKEIPSSSIRQQCKDLTGIPNLAVLCRMNYFGLTEGGGAHKLWPQTLKSVIGKEVKLVFVQYLEADNLWMVEIVMSELVLVHQIADMLRQNRELTSVSENRNEATEGEHNLDASPPQQLVFASVAIDTAYIGFAAAVTNPSEFCLVLEDLLLVMNQMSVMLDELPGQLSPLPEAHLIPGTCCLFKSVSKNKWCRAEIVNADATVVLNLVDYGYCDCLLYKDCSQLKRLPEELINLPKVTFPCILRGVKPVEADGQWTDEGAVFFQHCLYQKNLQIFFREFVSDVHWKVDILADGVHVAKELVDAGHASYIDVMLGLRYVCFRSRAPGKFLLKVQAVRKSLAREMKPLLRSQILHLRPPWKLRGTCHSALYLDLNNVRKVFHTLFRR
ncbi:tudor domain-containing protein 15 [Mastacembelus armatus]|uniref:tudor domain-containing protein 15 n=1 Tax=Mastacembelus armatus TaxID=205130 RepID=UPI000E456331|nr:tudor domain-containing protein 15-like [Mastacembelus armatus]